VEASCEQDNRQFTDQLGDYLDNNWVVVAFCFSFVCIYFCHSFSGVDFIIFLSAVE
jgi:hypothetical protein